MKAPLRNVTLQEALDGVYDCVQYKYRGPQQENQRDGMVLLGTATPSVFFAFDCLSSHGTPAKTFSYRDRYALAYVEVAKVDSPSLRLVRNFPIQAAREVWKDLNPELHCGIIFRRSHGTWDDEVLCQRWYPEVPKELE